MDLDTAIIEDIFDWEGASSLEWEQASQCSCYSTDTLQPDATCPKCGGAGVSYATPTTIKGLFRSQSRWLSFRREGELSHGEVQLTTPLDVKPGYVDRRVRDRLTVIPAVGDTEEGRVFYPSAQATPFLFGNIQLAWRVSLQAASETERIVGARS